MIGKRLQKAHVRVETSSDFPGQTRIGLVLTFDGDGDLSGCFESPGRELGLVMRKGARPMEVAANLRALATLIENEGV